MRAKLIISFEKWDSRKRKTGGKKENQAGCVATHLYPVLGKPETGGSKFEINHTKFKASLG